MTTTHLTVVAALSGATFVATGIVLARRADPRSGSWQVPAVLAAAFAGYSVYAVVEDETFGFWRDHTSTPWGSQIWLDLLLSVGTAWFLLQPRLRAAGINPLPWLALIVATGSIGLLAVTARTLHAEHERRSLAAGPPASVGSPMLRRRGRA